jgi:hypothetical protein
MLGFGTESPINLYFAGCGFAAAGKREDVCEGLCPPRSLFKPVLRHDLRKFVFEVATDARA